MLWVTTPVTMRTSAWRGEATRRAPNRSASYTGPNAAPTSISHPLHEPVSTWRTWTLPPKAAAADPAAGGGPAGFGGSGSAIRPVERIRRATARGFTQQPPPEFAYAEVSQGGARRCKPGIPCTAPQPGQAPPRRPPGGQLDLPSGGPLPCPKESPLPTSQERVAHPPGAGCLPPGAGSDPRGG